MIVICELCNQEYKAKPSDYKRYKHHYCSKECYNSIQRKEFINNFNRVQEGKYKLLEYIDKNNVVIQCNICGNITTNISSNLTQYKKTCYNCRNIKKDIDRLKDNLIKIELNIISDKKEALNNLIKRLDKALHKCKMQNRKKQRLKSYYKIKEIKRENRIKNNGYIDKDITLEKLYIRDNGICYLCGEKCDYDDYRITNKGYYIVGTKYPSIDHIKPLSKGGTHTWDNIQLAHISCNSRKYNKYDD